MEVREVMEAEDMEDEDSAEESRLARKVASFGMAAGRYYTPGRTNSEEFGAAENFTLGFCPTEQRIALIDLSSPVRDERS
jgi:hypothetical protein